MAPHLARLAAILALVAAAAAPASDATAAPPSSLYHEWLSGWASPADPAADFMRIGLDPETGEWGPAPVQQALQVSGIPAPPLVIHHPNGLIEVILDPSIVDYAVVHIGPDGRPTFHCGPAATPAPGMTAPVSSGAPDR
jgi:hypothetical protein